MVAQLAPLETVLIGRARATWLPDGAARFSPTSFLPQSDPESWKRYPDALDEEGRLLCSLGALLVELDGHIALVDTGLGVRRLRPPGGDVQGGDLLDSLARVGVRVEEVELVTYTHLHADHVGWTKTADGTRLAFPRARYAMHEIEWSYWRSRGSGHGGIGLEDKLAEEFAQRLEVTTRKTTVPEIELIHTPGHTPGHSVVVVSSAGKRLFVLGDMVHSPAQVSEDWGSYADTDPGVARRTRLAILDELVDPRTITAGTHFPNSVFGQVRREGGSRAWLSGQVPSA